MSSSNSTLIAPGVVPTHADFAPSIVFTLAYALLLPVAIWKFASRKTRCKEYIEPAIFILVQLAGWIIRIVLTQQTKMSTGLIAAESFLIGGTVVLIVNTLIAETRKLLTDWTPRAAPTEWNSHGRAVYRDTLGRVSWLLDLALLAILIMGIYSVTQMSGAMKGHPADIKTVDRLRKGHPSCSLHDLPKRPTCFNFIIGLLLTVVSAYQVTTAYRVSGTGGTAAFWCAMALPQLLTVVAIFSVNLRTLVPENPHKINYDRTPEATSANDTELGQRLEAQR
ncbi:hypothetical protein BKA62DRAFT_759975 [Auriculariales sp. MPI-PUGE-AT-0066]|nr:hypothetical protein BKA62DRAFT_759975 [Auriculariales sp. MPI-PUGE-AT-0066]